MYDSLMWFLVTKLHFQSLHKAVRALQLASAQKVPQLIIITIF